MLRPYVRTYLFAMLHQGAHLTGGHWTRKGDESLLKKLVAQHGAVVTTVAVHGSFMPYKGGIYQGCTNEETNHSVVVVGYGTENGVDYWLIKVGGMATWLPGPSVSVSRTPGARGGRLAT